MNKERFIEYLEKDIEKVRKIIEIEEKRDKEKYKRACNTLAELHEARSEIKTVRNYPIEYMVDNDIEMFQRRIDECEGEKMLADSVTLARLIKARATEMSVHFI